MNEDIILEIISHCSPKEIGKFRLLSKEVNKQTYQSYFINRHFQNTNSVFGYFIQGYKSFEYRSTFVFGFEEKKEEIHRKTRISLEFFPFRHVKIEACDTHQGILLCTGEGYYNGTGRILSYYFVCKPATKQYRIIPKPKTRYSTLVTGLMVIQSDPFRYKIVRVSKPMIRERRNTKSDFFYLNCEVFDSDFFAWKRLNDLELSLDEYFAELCQPVSSYGFVHWFTCKRNVIRFCMRTETWSILLISENIVRDGSLKLISYEGKIGVICLNLRERYEVWVLENSFGKSWIKVKEVEDKHGDPIWFPSSDVVSMEKFCRLIPCNINNTNKSRYLQMNTQNCLSYLCYPRIACFPFYSNYERVCFNEDRARRSVNHQ